MEFQIASLEVVVMQERCARFEQYMLLFVRTSKIVRLSTESKIEIDISVGKQSKDKAVQCSARRIILGDVRWKVVCASGNLSLLSRFIISPRLYLIILLHFTLSSPQNLLRRHRCTLNCVQRPDISSTSSFTPSQWLHQQLQPVNRSKSA
jgi:hypothetical protein